MLVRKVIGSFVAGTAAALWFCLWMRDGNNSFLTQFGIVAFVAYPVALIYGSIISIALEAATDRWIPNRLMRYIGSGLGHAGFGALFGLPLMIADFGGWLAWIFALTALVYFGVDLLLRSAEDKRWRRKIRMAMLALPVVAIAGFAADYY
jgi:hypothetical protein